MGTEAKWNSETISDTRLNEMTHLVGTTTERDASVAWPTSMLWWDTTLNRMYRNSGTEGTPVSSVVGSTPAGTVLPTSPNVDDVFYLTDRDDGDCYYDGTNWRRKTDRGIYGLTGTPDGTEDMSSTTGWTFQDNGEINVTGGVHDGNYIRGNAVNNDASHKDINGGIFSNTNWVLRFKWTLVEKNTAVSSANFQYMVLSSTTSATDSEGTHDAIGLGFVMQSSNNANMVLVESDTESLNDGIQLSPQLETGIANSTVRYCEIRRISTTEMVVQLYSDAEYTTKVGATLNKTIPSTITNIRYLWLGNTNGTPTSTNTIQADIDDVEWWDGVFAVA